MTETRTIVVDALARVEGEGGLTIRFRGDEPESVELRIFEPPRLFEALLRGRSMLEAPDITARICGICPVAYQMSACHAIEDALGLRVPESVRRLRRLLYAGEWIESHLLHMFLLHAPDFLGLPDVLAMSEEHADLVRTALRIKRAGNAIVRTLGGREIHPVNVRVGGFHRALARTELDLLVPELAWSKDALSEIVERLASWDFPDMECDHEFVSLRHSDEYPFNEGRLVSSTGLDIDVHEYEDHFEEFQVAHSTALHSRRVGGGPYLVGPLARFSLCFDSLRPVAQELARRIGLTPPCKNPFRSLLVRGIEALHAIDEALAIISAHSGREAGVAVPVRAGVGMAATEAPRGLLFHRYVLADDGSILFSKITPPTSQNLPSMEKDLFVIAERLARLPEPEARLLAERTVRNYDPCISCSTHFLKLRIERGEP